MSLGEKGGSGGKQGGVEGQKSVLGMYCMREEFMLNTHYNNLFLLFFMFLKNY